MGTVVAFTGGGTGGHLYPGIAVAQALREADPGIEIVWIGNGEGMDRKVVECAGLPFRGVPSGKFRRDLSLKNLADLVKIGAGYFASRSILRELAPALLFSKGGYVSVPPCAAAAGLGLPVFTHESDVNPGLATRLNARFAERILVSYGETLAWLGEKRAAKAIRVGNPVRAAISGGDRAAGLSFLGFDGRKPVLLVLGGSQGARELNELVSANLDAILAGWDLAHQHGPAHKAEPRPGYRPFGYVSEEMPDLLAAADLVVGRSGAGTLWECSAAGKPMILLPLRNSASRGDQVLNAELFERAGAAIVLPPGEGSGPALLRALEALLASPGKRKALANAAAALTGEPAAPLIARMILERIGRKRP